MMSHEYCSKQIEYMLSDVTLVRIDGEYDFVELADCATNNRNVSTFVESIFEKSKPLAFIIMTDFVNNEFYCTNKDGDIIEECKSKKLNSINVINYISKDLLINTKKILDKGVIIFIKENEFNLSELSATLNYIKSRGYNIVSINDLLL